MPAQCSICLSSFKDPVCLPCGHLYCKNCLTDHVNVPTNRGMTSTCPDCRAIFHIAIPDLAYLPEKYHPFISHAVRRVYVDLSQDAALQKKLKQTEKTLLAKTKGEEVLMRRCEDLIAAINAHKHGERDANDRVEELEERVYELESEHGDKVEALNEQCHALEEENSQFRKKTKALKAQLELLQRSLDASEARTHSLEKTLFARHPDSDQSIRVTKGFPRDEIISVERVVKPLPRRRIQRRARDDEGSSPCVAPSKRARTSQIHPLEPLLFN